ncbi:MAG: 16S rRNA processing protein RimM [Acidobacteriota bacterium]|nr:MAG: 16S rRNA processing protein RimM [Acidobacteriota bacterium]
MDDLVAIARVAKPRGIKGEVSADLLTDFPERFDGLKNVTAVFQSGERHGLTIEGHWFQGNRVVLKFSGVDSMDDAEDLRNAEICVGESEVVELEPDEFFEWELEGCFVEDVTGKAIGTVETLMRTGGPELLVVRDGIKEHLIPFVEAICVEVDIGEKRIIIDPPEGLLEF